MLNNYDKLIGESLAGPRLEMSQVIHECDPVASYALFSVHPTI